MTGIYKITNPKGRVYIGQAIDIVKRFYHYFNLTTAVKEQPKIYNSLKKYGVENHRFEIIELCDVDELNLIERKYQDLFEVIGRNGLNCVLTEANDLPKRLSQETKNKISDSNMGRVASDETRQKISKSNMGKTDSVHTKLKKSKSQTKPQVDKTILDSFSPIDPNILIGAPKLPPNSVMTYEEAYIILSMYASGHSTEIIRKLYPHVSTSALQKLRHGETYKCVSNLFEYVKPVYVGKPVICVEDNLIFDSAIKMAKHYNLSKDVMYRNVLNDGLIKNILNKTFKYI